MTSRTSPSSLTIAVALVLVWATIAKAGAGVPLDFLLARGRVGLLTGATTAHEVFTLFGRARVKRVDLRLEGMPAPALEVRADSTTSRPSLIAELFPPNPDRIWRVRVLDKRFKTATGLGVGSSLEQIRAQGTVRVLVGEGNVVAHVQSLDMSFDFGSGFYPSIDLPSSARVQSILVLFPPPGRSQ